MSESAALSVLRRVETFLSDSRIGTTEHMDSPAFYEDAYALLREVRAVLAESGVPGAEYSVSPRGPGEALIAVLLEEGILKGRSLLPHGDSTHGSCCTCRDCRHFYDECVCQHNLVWAALAPLLSAEPLGAFPEIPEAEKPS